MPVETDLRDSQTARTTSFVTFRGLLVAASVQKIGVAGCWGVATT